MSKENSYKQKNKAQKLKITDELTKTTDKSEVYWGKSTFCYICLTITGLPLFSRYTVTGKAVKQIKTDI